MEACVRDARFDQTFKVLLGEKGAEDRAISFLNAALRLKTDGDRIERIQFLDRSVVSPENRTVHFDVNIQGLCSTYSGHTFIVEMQKARISSHINRWIYYGAREISAIGERFHNARARSLQDNDVPQKNFYSSITPVRVVVIADFDSPQLQMELQNPTDFVVDLGLCELKSQVLASPLMSWTFLVLPRFLALSASGNSLDFTGKNLEAWLYLMTRKDCEAVRVTKELVANDDAVAQGFHRVSHLKSHETERLHDERIAFDSQSQLRQDDEMKGRIEGEKKKSMDIAHKLHLMSHLGLSAEEISDITGCSSLEIKKYDQN
jgi:predicted transposase/invertase (TIGR01784 family)